MVVMGLALVVLGCVVGGTYSEAHFGSCSRPTSENYVRERGLSSVELMPPRVVCTYSSRPRTTRHFAGFGIAWVASIAVACWVGIDALRRGVVKRRAGPRGSRAGEIGGRVTGPVPDART
jgi:hypothetical protein